MRLTYRKLIPGWRLTLREWIHKLGMPTIMVTHSALQNDREIRDLAGSRLDMASWWDGEVAHLSERPEHKALEWLYLTAHFGLADLERRNLPDFGLFMLHPEEALRVEAAARDMVVGMAVCMGANEWSLQRLAWEWRLTNAARKGLDYEEVLPVHLAEVKSEMSSRMKLVGRMQLPRIPLLWEPVKWS